MLTLRFAGPAERAPIPPEDPSSGVQVWHNRRGGVVARGFRHAGSYWMAWPYLATYEFSPGSPFIAAYPEPSAPVDVIWDVYRRSVLPMALQVLGHEALHASAVVTAEGIVAFCAVSETGKSTIAFGLRRLGYAQWSDDGVVFEIAGAQVLAEPLPFEARLRPESRELFGQSSARGIQGNGLGEQQFTERVPIAAIGVLERVSGPADASPLIQRTSPARAFTELLTHAHEFSPHDTDRRARMMRTYLELSAIVPVFHVSFVPNRSRLDHLLRAIVDALGLSPPSVTRVRHA